MPRRHVSLPDAFKLVLSKDQDQWPPAATLIVAAYYGDIRRLKEIAKSMDVEGKGLQETLAHANFLGTYALHAVCDSGNMPTLQYLVEDLNMDVNKPDTMGDLTPAMHAVLYGKLPALRFLADHGANLHQQPKGITLLHAAAEGGRPEIFKFLLSRGARADVESTSPLTSFTPLFLATCGGYASILEILLEQNADPNVRMGDQVTPISFALRHSSVPCLKLLVQAGADVNGFGSYNPLAKAAKKGLTEAIKCLLEAGADPNVPDSFGRLPIELAAEYGTWEDVELLFPVTSKIPTVADWSVNGIISHVYLEVMQLQEQELEELLRSSAEVLGKGKYANTYKAVLDEGSTLVVKRLKIEGVPEAVFKKRIAAIGAIEHELIVPLRRYYLSKDEKLVVYDYFPMGSLSSNLHGITWETRSAIALSAARAVAYIHSTDATASHGNINSSNILLTGSYEARVSEHGLKTLVSSPTSITNNDTAQKDDVYSFGIILLEMLTGKLSIKIFNSQEPDLLDWILSVPDEHWAAQVFDKKLLQENSPVEMVQVAKLAIRCCEKEPTLRPVMSEAAQRIEEILRSKAGDRQLTTGGARPTQISEHRYRSQSF